jgi:adenosylcobinamide-phosphate synthase
MLPFGLWPDPAFDPLLLLLLALLADIGVGEMGLVFRLIPHPVVALGRLIDTLDHKLNRPQRSNTERRLRGVMLLVSLCTVMGGLGWIIQSVALTLPFGWLVELFLLITLVAQRSLYDHVKAVAIGLQKDGLRGGRDAVAMIVGRDPEQLDEHGVSRAAIESCAENFSDGIVAPVFWYLIGGLPGIMIYKTVNTLDSMIGHKKPHYLAFGWASARFDDLLNLIPARLAGLLLCIAAAFIWNGRPLQALRTMLRDARKHRSPNAGWPEAACAGALGLALCGPRLYRGEGLVTEPWIGEGRAQATAQDIHAAVRLMSIGCLLNGVGVAVLWSLQGLPW